MKRNVLVVSHADADGHVIAEQVRRNLDLVPAFAVDTLIDPDRTSGHKAWLHLSEIPEIDRCDYVFFVDLMFAPESFGAEADALVRFANARPKKKFFVLDHHPLPMRRLSGAPNLRAVYHQDVFDCTVGLPSPMMIIAALCEKQPTRARAIKKPIDVIIAKGMKRAAALGGPLPGKKLLALLRHNRWRDLELLGREPAERHRLPRGRRSSRGEPSTELARLDRAATALLAPSRTPHAGENAMSYDFESATDREPPVVTNHVPQPNDLEAIVVLLQLAAIELTPTTGSAFTLDALLAQVRELGGDEVVIDPKDIKIVLDKASFLKKEGKVFRLR